MAIVFPEHLPKYVTDDPARDGEKKVYAALETLPDSYHVYYSVHWQKISNELGMAEGEADFVITHANKGIIVLEVKGGGIDFDAQNGTWVSQSRSKNTHVINDPIMQGSRNHHELQKKLESLPGWPDRLINIQHAVCFPDIRVTQKQFLKVDLPREMIIDANDLDQITISIEQLFASCFGKKMSNGAPGPACLALVEKMLANSFHIKTTLGIELRDEDERLVELTEQQFNMLTLLGDRKRVAISGCAGSGKTMLALYKAKQFAELGLKALLVCFTPPITDYLRPRLPPEVDVCGFHELCNKMVMQEGIKLKPNIDKHELYDTILPEALFDAAVKIGRIYDAIIVDEGQDFQENYWIGLEALLKQDGYLYIFYDDNQNLYQEEGKFGGLISEPSFPLTQNCRNTKSIHEIVIKFYNNPDRLKCFCPKGRKPEWHTYTDFEDLSKQLQKKLDYLVNEEQINNDEIVILTPHGETNTKLVPGLKMGNFTLTDKPVNDKLSIQATSVYKFKGLDKRIVIFAELDREKDFNKEMVFYVGFSRARNHLIVFGADNVPETLQGGFEKID